MILVIQIWISVWMIYDSSPSQQRNIVKLCTRRPHDVEILNGSHWKRIFIDGVEIEWKGFIVTIEVAMGIFKRCGWDDGVPRGKREEVPLCWASVAEEDLWSKVSLLVTITICGWWGSWYCQLWWWSWCRSGPSVKRSQILKTAHPCNFEQVWARIQED